MITSLNDNDVDDDYNADNDSDSNDKEFLVKLECFFCFYNL